MKKNIKRVSLLFAVLMIACITVLPAYAAFSDAPSENAAAVTQVEAAGQAANDTAKSGKAIAAGIAVGLAACGGGIGMGMAIAKSTEAISRQPEVKGDVRGALMLGLVFIETAIIYALIIAILVIFVL